MNNKSILLVEDEKVLRDVYQLVLESKGYNVYTAVNGLEGLTALKKYQSKLVILDVLMPVMDGREFLRNFEPSDYPDTKIIVYSNISDSNAQEEMIMLGAERLILKSSMSPNDLITLVEYYLN